MAQTWRREGDMVPTIQGCATWGQPGEGGDLTWDGIEQPWGDAGRGRCACWAAARCYPHSLEGCFKVSFFPALCHCS